MATVNVLTLNEHTKVLAGTRVCCPSPKLKSSKPPLISSMEEEAGIGSTSLNRPVAVRHAGVGTDRLFVVEQAGKILILNSLGELLETEFFDITGRVEDGSNEQGLLGLAFDPDYESNGYSYVYYIYNVSGGTDWTRVSRSACNPDSPPFWPAKCCAGGWKK